MRAWCRPVFLRSRNESEQSNAGLAGKSSYAFMNDKAAVTTTAGMMRSSRANFALGILFVVSFFHYMDRHMLGVLLPAIKEDLVLSDTQIGFMTGVAFTLVFVGFGIPIARLADNHSRRLIVSVALGFWSLMMAVCGLAQNFVQLTVARVMVGVGEAGCNPSSHSLIADYFPVEKRAQALSIFSLGGPIGIIVGFILGGWLTEVYSWRVALFVVGAPGILAAIFVYLRLEEPARGQSDGLTEKPETLPFLTVVKVLLSKRAFLHASIGGGLFTVSLLGVLLWLPSYFTRSFGLGMGEVSTWLALILGSSQLIGMLLSGYVSDALGRRDLRWYAWVPAIAIFVSTPLFMITFLTSNVTVAFASLFIPFAVGIMQAPPTFAIIQGVAPANMRAMAAALLLLIANLIGGAIGPQVIGILSDVLRPSMGEDSLGFALLSVTLVTGVWSSIHYLIAGRSLRQELVSGP